MTFADDLTAGLRQWTRHHDPHVKAAVELLLWHGFWLRRPDFCKACVTVDGDVWIRWAEARAFVDGGPRASTSELAILDLGNVGHDQGAGALMSVSLAGGALISASGHLATAAEVLRRACAETSHLTGLKDSGDV